MQLPGLSLPVAEASLLQPFLPVQTDAAGQPVHHFSLQAPEVRRCFLEAGAPEARRVFLQAGVLPVVMAAAVVVAALLASTQA